MNKDNNQQQILKIFKAVDVQMVTIVQKLITVLKCSITQINTKSDFVHTTLITLLIVNTANFAHLRILNMICKLNLFIIIYVILIFIFFIIKLKCVHLILQSMIKVIVSMHITDRIIEENLIFMIMIQFNAKIGKLQILLSIMIKVGLLEFF